METVTQMVDKKDILKGLDNKKNVLLMGAPGTGKSRLMNDVAEAFEKGLGSISAPTRVNGNRIPIPALYDDSGLEVSFLSKKHRKVFRTTLHQNSKYRDFLTGIVPTIGGTGFRINEGILYRANEYAKKQNSAALLIIDEINRGPAIEVFGGSIVAIESDKRSADDNRALPMTQFFELMSPTDGNMIPYCFSPNLYILAAMNQADVSVAPLDVAFLRRWLSVKLEPDYESLYSAFNVEKKATLPEVCENVEDAYAIAFAALEKINQKIAIGRGEEYEIGQGIFLSTKPENISLEATLKFLVECWQMMYAHIEELFFGDVAALAYLVNANNDKSPYSVNDYYFAGETKTVLHNEPITENNIIDLMWSLASEE